MGAMWPLCLGVLAALCGFAPTSRAESPLAAHGVFVSHSYAFSFPAPQGLTYCRLPEGWTGSDHGTVLFLTPPASCGSTGYPSISRGFEPETTPRIEVYYGLWDSEVMSPPSCRQVGHILFLGRMRPLCGAGHGSMAIVEVSGHYVADSTTEASVTLVTSRHRMRDDLRVFRTLVGTASTCSIPWQDAQRHRRIMGSGRRCPDDGDFF